MARCGCGSTACGCLVQGSGAISVTGSGSGASPYVISGGGVLTVTDTATVDLTLAGSGSAGSPYSLTATATVDVEDLANLDSAGVTTGQVIAKATTGWTVIPAPTAPPGAITTDTTLEGDGSAGDALGITEQPTGTYTPTLTAETTNPAIGNGIISGRYVKDPTSNWCQLSIVITCGSTTTKGSGEWNVSLPSGMDAMTGRLQILPLLVTYVDGRIRVGQALIEGGDGEIHRLYATHPSSSTGSAVLSAGILSDWTSGCRIAIEGKYELEP